MHITNLDEIQSPVLSNETVYRHLKHLFFSASEDMGFQRFTGIAAFVDRITDRQLLDASVKFLTKNGFALRDRPEWISQLLASGDYTEMDLVKIEARSYSLQITFLLYKSMNNLLNSELSKLKNCGFTDLTQIPDLSIHINGRTITDNSDEANDFIRKKMVRGMKTQAEALPADKGKNFLSDVAISYANVELDLNDPGYFKNEISYISTVKENLVDKNVPKPVDYYSFVHPEIFINDGFALWDYLMENAIEKNYGRLSDIAYFYWRMFEESDQYIYQRPEVFKKWFKRVYREELGQFATLTKVRTVKRDRAYSIALEAHKKSTRQ